MQRKKAYSFILSILMLNLFVTFYAAQAENLKSYKIFFDEKLEDYKKWLEHANLSNIISIDSLEIEPDKVFLRLKMPDKHNWIRLNEYTKKTYQKELADILFNQFAFQADLKNEQLDIKVDGTDAVVLIFYENNNIVTRMPKKMGPVSSNLDIPINELKISSDSISLKEKKIISDVKNTIKNELRKYAEPYKARSSAYKFEIVSDIKDQLVIEINNIKKFIIGEDDYFERIKITSHIWQDNDSLRITFTLYGKYAAGIIWAPRESRYKDMEPNYSGKLKKFISKFETIIYSTLNE
ncbi:MAG: hypothetical protein D3911_03950 [Candidatus Electrothrix sp. AW3_4]|nr:hypothetical protein [Candidatus Electrothrix gigas]